MTDSENPFVLLARITVKEGMVNDYLEIAEAADKAVEKTEEGMLFCLSPLELCQYILAKGVRKHGSKALF